MEKHGKVRWEEPKPNILWSKAEARSSTHAQGTGLSTAKAEHVRRSAEGTKFGYRTSNGPLPATKHAAKPANAAPANGKISRSDRALQSSTPQTVEVRGKKLNMETTPIGNHPFISKRRRRFTSARMHQAEQHKQLQLLLLHIRHQHNLQLLFLGHRA